jgi:NADH-quinone oxidoreductase subunit J
MGIEMHDMLHHVIFFVFAGITLFSALMVITQNNPVRSVLFLVVAFLASSVLWLLVQAEFLALILVLVYVGAVMTLFLFVIMMLNIDREAHSARKIRLLPIILIIVAALVGLLQKALPLGRFSVDALPNATAMPATSLSDTEALGMVLYTDYLAGFEIAAVILLVAIIAAITLVHRSPIRSKRQNIVKQIMTRREDRVTVLSMKTEK